MASAGWPTVDQLRGKFTVNLIGNWSTAGADWVQYATHDVPHRAAFPMQSVFEVDPTCTASPPPPKKTIGTKTYTLCRPKIGSRG